MASVPSIFGKGSGGNGRCGKSRESIYRRRGSRDPHMNAQLVFSSRRGNRIRGVFVLFG